MSKLALPDSTPARPLRLLLGLLLAGLAACGGELPEREPGYPVSAPAPQTVVVAYPSTVMLAPAATQLPARAPAPVAPPDGPADGAYVMRNVASKQCLDVPRRASESRTLLWQWDCNATDAQQWTLRRTAPRVYEVRSAASGKCLDVPGQEKGTNVTLWQFDCNGTDAQQWTLESTADGSYVLRSRASDQCLDVPHGRELRGLGVQQYTCHGGAPQRWVLTKV